MSRSIVCSGATSVALSLCASAAFAQAAPPPAPVAQHTEAVAVKEVELPRQIVTNIGAGATINSGNTKTIAANAGGQFGYKKNRHQLALDLLGTVGYAADPNSSDSDYERNNRSVVGRGRYDLFLSRNDALFIAVQPRHDVNAGLDLRLQNQIGYLRNVYYPSDDHRLWLEAGYDLTYDNFAEVTTTTLTDITADVPSDLAGGDKILRQSTVTGEPDAEVIHSARVFIGYTNHLSALATLNLGVETLIEPKDLENIRVNGVADLTSSVSDNFKLGIQFRTLFDNVPVPGKKEVDTITAVQLIYTYDSLAEAAAAAAAAPAAAPCDCSQAVADALASCNAGAKAPAEPQSIAVGEPAPGTSPAEAPTEAAPQAPAAPSEAAPQVEPAPQQ